MRLFPALLAFVLVPALLAAAEPAPLSAAHAHNDYAHARPLLDALEQGFANVEADVWLVEGQLLVAHDRKSVESARTLATLYLEPLRARVQQNGGAVYRGGAAFTLLIDVKSEAAPTYAALDAELRRYERMLTRFTADGVKPGAVTVIISGNRARTEMLAQSERLAAFDGRKVDLESDAPAAFVPWISENWRTLSTWSWTGEMPAADRVQLQQWVQRAHEHGRKLRFWNVPDRPEAWAVLLDAGVDLIGTDDLPGLARFLRSRVPRRSE